MFDKGDVLDVFVTFLEVRGKVVQLWVQTDFGEYEKLEELMKDVSSETCISAKKLNVGSIYLAKYEEDDNWYRARLLSKDGERSSVLFIDFGNTETVPVRNIIDGHRKYLGIPPQSSRLALADLRPSSNLEWSADEVSQLKEKLTYATFSCEVLHPGAPGCAPSVRLLDKSQSAPRVVDGLLSAGVGRPYDNGSFAQPSPALRQLKAGCDHHVYVVYSDSPVDFWIQLAAETDVLDSLHARLESLLGSAEPVHLDPSQIDVGLTCLACYCGDSYYRAVVSDVYPTERKCRVTFIDYGNSNVVAFELMRQLPSEFVLFPPAFAIHCALSGDAINSVDMNALLESQTIGARVVSMLPDGTHVVRLSEVSAGGAADVALTPFCPDLAGYNNVCVSHVEGDGSGRFYCQLLENAATLDRLMSELQKETPVALPSVDVGVACVASSRGDGIRYRAQVQALVDGQTARVRLADFGSTETLPLTCLSRLSTAHAATPIGAIECTLFGSKDAARLAEVMRRYESKVVLVAKVILRIEGVYEIELHDTSNSADVKIVDLVNGAADDVVTTIDIPQLDAGATEQLSVTAVVADSTFYGQLSRCSVSTLPRFQDDLHSHYASGGARPLGRAVAGLVCCSQFSGDGGYYRCRVVRPSAAGVLVEFVDYGNKETKALDQLLPLETRFVALPQCGAYFKLARQVPLAALESCLQSRSVLVKVGQRSGDTYDATITVCPENTDVNRQLEK